MYRLLAASLLTLVLIAPASAADLAASNAWVRLPAVSGRPGAAYFVLKGGDHAQTVTGISSPSAKRAELHETRMTGGLMKMAPTPRVEVGKGETIAFQPGGRHAMLFGLDPALKPGAPVRLDIKLSNGKTITATAVARGVADGPPSSGQMDMPMKHDQPH